MFLANIDKSYIRNKVRYSELLVSRAIKYSVEENISTKIQLHLVLVFWFKFIGVLTTGKNYDINKYS